ncbi:MAG: gliding motility protein GldC [Saprospiraceae bacterium]|nr:gliding motility protein GldC [Saprospiraceae bacterium]
MSKNADIEIKVDLGEDQIPENISWKSIQNKQGKWMDSKAMMVSFFDKESKDTLRIDLWTKDFQVMEMDRFFYYTLRGMTDTYLRATNNKELSEEMRSFTEHFGKATGLISS